MIKEEGAQSTSPEEQMPGERGLAQSSPQDAAKEDILKVAEDSKDQQGLTPPPSSEIDSKPIGLGINTDGIANSPAPGTAEPQNSSVDSLFDIPDNENGDSELNFESMDFSLHDSNQDPSQIQADSFDLSTFGTNTQDFNMNEMQTDSHAINNTNDTNKEVDDIFDMGNTDSMDMDLDLGMADAEGSIFESMFLGDDAGMSGGGDMEHGDFEDDFFVIKEND